MDEKTVSRLITFLIVMVTIAWVATLIIPAFSETYKAPPELAGIMLGLVGLLTASYRKLKQSDKDGDDE